METLRSLFQSIAYSVPNMGVMDVIDILLVTFTFYKIIGLIRSTSALRVAKGILALLIVTFLTDILRLNTVNFILNRILELGFIALVIVFQPELRRVLERLGSRKISGFLGTQNERSEIESTIEATVNACEILSRDRIGALIVFERSLQLREYFKTGTEVDAKVTSQLLRSIFFPKAALHDGAVIIREGRLAAAGCVLPLTENAHLSKDLGTRHRAGIGMSEVSDALVVIVSEETGTISAAVGGMLKRHLAPQMLERLLKNELLRDTDQTRDSLWNRLKKILRSGGNGNAEK